jgi:hypothetical protein
VFAAALLAAQPARAQQTVNFTIGYFAPFGEDARVDGDVLNANREVLLFDVGDFGSATVGGEWLIPLGNFVEAGAGISFSRRTVPTIYTDFVDENDNEIEQELRLRMVPIALTVRVLPLGQSSPVQPYFGAGLGIFNWRYSETGDFIDTNGVIFRDSFVDSGSETGPIVLGGIRFSSDRATAGGEIRYHKADADLPIDFAGPKLDLGGWTYNFTVGVRF